MWASDLVGCQVYDAAGARVGRVHDISFEMSGGGSTPVRFRLTGLSCRDSLGVGHRLGYGTCDMAGPWPLDALFRRYGRGSSLHVRWSDVAQIQDRRITLRRRREHLQTERDAEDRR